LSVIKLTKKPNNAVFITFMYKNHKYIIKVNKGQIKVNLKTASKKLKAKGKKKIVVILDGKKLTKLIKF
jgi:hypothetical protein